MSVAVPIVARKQPLERVEQVVVGARPGLDERNTGGGVRHEHVAQAGPAPGAALSAERPDGVGEVDDAATGGVDVEEVGVHDASVRAAGRPLPALIRRSIVRGEPVAPPGRCPVTRRG